MKILIQLIMVLCLTVSGMSYAASGGSGTPADHEQLRALLEHLRDAINSRDIDALTPYLHAPFAATMITQDLVSTPDQLKNYFQRWMEGDSAMVKKLTITPEADDLTNIYDDKYGIVHGTNIENYELVTGNNYTIHSRWTATVIKDQGQWKLLAIHSGVNFLDNPVMDAVTDETLTMAFIAGGMGVVTGFLIAWLIRRKKLA